MITARIAGTVRTWYGDVGDFVDSDDIIAEIETADGTRVEISAPAAGRITEIHALAGEAVERGAVLAHIEEASPLLYELLDGGQKPKRKLRRKAAATPPRRYFVLILALILLLALGGMAATFLLVTPVRIVTTTPAATPAMRFYPGGYAILRQPVGDLMPGTVMVQQAFYDRQTWRYTISANGVTARDVPESLLDGAPVPAPTPTMIYDYGRWGWANPLILAEPVADFPAGTRVRISSAMFDGAAWQLDVMTEDNRVLHVREAQLAPPPNPPADPRVTPTAAFLDSAAWNSYSWVTLEQVGTIPANTRVRILGARYSFDGWIYTVIAKGDATGVEVLQSQLALAAQATTPTP